MDLRGGRLQAARHLRLPLRDDQGAARRGGAFGRRPGLRGADGAGPGGVAARRRACAHAGAGGELHAGHEEVVRFARDAGFRTRFVGYETTEADTVLRVRGARQRLACWPSSRRAPFYPEGGGQVSDSGLVETPSGRARVVDVYRLGDDQALALEPIEGEIGPGESAKAVVERDARLATMRNHTATHLLHAALRERLGTHVRQAGSYVGPDKLRFDFTHGERLSRRRAGRGRAARVSGWIAGNHPRARDRDHPRRGRAPRRDGAVRREVRRLGAHGRGRGGLARAVRRHPRRQHRRARALPPDDRDLERVQRAPDRGGDGSRSARSCSGAHRAPARAGAAAAGARGPARATRGAPRRARRRSWSGAAAKRRPRRRRASWRTARTRSPTCAWSSRP